MATFINPVVGGRVTSKFGPRVINGKREIHLGLDIAKVGNVPILATSDGIVRDIWGENRSSYGNVIFLQHTIGGKRYDSVYAHLKSFSVKLGQRVKQGDVIGYMGNTGRSYGQHLHFEIHNGPWVTGQKNAIDPLKLIVEKKVEKVVNKYEVLDDKDSKVWRIQSGTFNSKEAAIKAFEKSGLSYATIRGTIK